MIVGPFVWPIGTWAGTQSDFLARIKSILPRWWGDDDTPVLDGVLSAPSWALAFIYQLIGYVRLQTRLATATDGFLDLFAADFFGTALPRNPGEIDSAYRARIKASLFPPKNTRAALVQAIVQLTGIAPTIVEPQNPGDTSAFGSLLWLNVPSVVWSSRTMPSQCFVTVHVGTTGVTLAQACAAVERVRPASTVVWVQTAP